LDNTVVAWRRFDVSEGVTRWIADARARGVKLCIVSNTWNSKRLDEIAADLGVSAISHAVSHAERVPGGNGPDGLPAEHNRGHRRSDNHRHTRRQPGRTLHHSGQSIPSPEFIGTKINRLFEKLILPLLRRKA